ncbi:GNAT family N-acetyltransferase [Vallicoccus soli]|uniref:GNAT family N-acetyltransferase n=1 Tax=Vallicoccus soli TaxID=2339232 RepID=A0A3A3Z0B4_9ACTN|nr:GNAT family N-acetyltransferase [Vallicoccus soli]RJK94892.1 GNAT family N-acetyltransferase [Vallicoccus soli]
MGEHLRTYRPEDLPGLYDVCLRTGDGGRDATALSASPTLLGDVYAAPYAVLEPEHVHVLDDGAGGVAGYVLGTADTARFVRRYRAEWLPAARARHRAAPPDPRTFDELLLAALERPERLLHPELAAWPAHLHIDLLPAAQGRGWGRRLMERFLAGLHAAGVPAVHLAMASANTAARAFYDRLGFVELTVDGPAATTWLGRPTG